MESYGFRNLGFGYLSFGSGFVGNLVVLVMEEENEQYSDNESICRKNIPAYAPSCELGFRRCQWILEMVDNQHSPDCAYRCAQSVGHNHE